MRLGPANGARIEWLLRGALRLFPLDYVHTAVAGASRGVFTSSAAVRLNGKHLGVGKIYQKRALLIIVTRQMTVAAIIPARGCASFHRVPAGHIPVAPSTVA